MDASALQPDRGAPARRWAVRAVGLSSAAIGTAYASAFLPGGTPGWAPWLFVAGTALMMVAMMALGAAGRAGLGPLRIPFALVLLVLVGGFGVVLALPPADPADPTLWLGLPPRAAVVLYGVGLVPFLLVPVAYTWTFHRMTLRPGDLERVREDALRARRASPPPGE